MIKRGAVFAIVLFGLMALGGVVSETAAQDERFSLRSLQGAWGYSASGSVSGFTSAAVGRLVMDGTGGCTNVAYLNLGGSVIPLTSMAAGGQCSYDVGPDGRGSIDVTFIDPLGNPVVFSALLVIVDHQKEFRFIPLDPVGTTIATGVAKRQ
jgi:hypothetical protein